MKEAIKEKWSEESFIDIRMQREGDNEAIEFWLDILLVISN